MTGRLIYGGTDEPAGWLPSGFVAINMWARNKASCFSVATDLPHFADATLARPWSRSVRRCSRDAQDANTAMPRPSPSGGAEYQSHPYEQGFDLKLWGLTAYRDPSEYGNDLGEEYPASTYGNSLI